MLKRLFVIVLFLIISISFAISQNQYIIDSLKNELQKVDDSLKTDIYNSIAWEYRNSDIPKCIEYARKASEIALYYGNQKSHIVAISFIGVAYRNIGDYPTALDYYFEALKQSEDLQDKEQIAYSLNNIGNIYIYQENFQEAEQYIERTLDIAKEIEHKKLLAYSYLNLGRIYKNLNDFETSLNYLFETLKIRKELGDQQSIGSALYDIAETFLLMGNIQKSLSYFFESLEILEIVGDKDGLAFCYNNIAKIYLKQKQYTEALKYAKRGLSISNNIGSKYEQKKSHYTLSEIHAENGHYKMAFEFLKKYIVVNDSIFNQESISKMAQYQVKAELEKQEAQIKLLIKDKKLEEEKAKRNKQLMFFVLAVLFLVLIIMYYVYRNYVEKKRINELLHDQKEEIEAQRDTIDLERKKAEDLLLNILPEQTAIELKEKGVATTRLYKNITVLFADLIGFSSRSENMDPKTLIEELNECFIKFDEITSKYGVEKIKTIGDAYMCAGGIPHCDGSSVLNTIKVAIEMQTFMNQWKEEKKANNESYWEMRIGIHTGPVIGGVIGKKKFAYDIWGNTVNIASRIESSSQAGKINISEATYKLVKNQVECRPRGKIQAKNIGEIEMYYVLF